jgi:membrane-bound lytic murein transglycosylase D
LFLYKMFCIMPAMQTLLAQPKILFLLILTFIFSILTVSAYPPEFSFSNEHMLQQITALNLNLPVTSVWDSIRADFVLNHKTETAQVQAQIKILLSEKNKLISILTAASPYIYYIHQQTQKRHLPSELVLIPIIESEFNPHDHSTKGASGLWQLMPDTALVLKIKVVSSYDGRRSVVSSTTAALDYFKDLNVEFKNNWYLTLAAYNSGDGRVRSSTRKNTTENIWNLSLPKETKLYVAKLLAVAAIIKNPEKYGVILPLIPNQAYFVEYKVKKPMGLTAVTKMTGIDIESLKKLNPDYNPKQISHYSSMLLVPVENVKLIKPQMSAVLFC